MDSALNFPTVLIWLALGLTISLSINLLQAKFRQAQRRSLYVGYRLMIPYGGLLTGSISPYLMGLTNINWATSLGIGAAILFAILLVLLLIKVTLPSYQHKEPQARGDGQNWSTENLASHLRPRSIWQGKRFVDNAFTSVTEQFYWSFIRAAIWEALIRFQPGFELPAYHALWIAGLVALPDTLLHTKSLYGRMINVCIYVATSALFFFTRNFWLCALLHIGMFVLLHQYSDEQSAPIAESPPRSLLQIEGRIR